MFDLRASSGWHSSVLQRSISGDIFEIFHCFESQTEQAGLAQSVERMTAEREVAGSIPGAGHYSGSFKITEK